MEQNTKRALWWLGPIVAVALSCSSTGDDSASNTAGGSGGGGQAGDGGTGPCVPRTCEEAGAECGVIADGCGDTLQCGGCDTGETCGGGGPNLCGTSPCTPKTCAQLSAACGLPSDGCGNVLDCGTCPDGYVCGSAQAPYQCVAFDGGVGGGGTGGSGGGGACSPGESCDDGDACTKNDTCNSAGECVGGTTVACDDPPGPCYVSSGVCDSFSGNCSYPYEASGIPCTDDGNDCTIDQCDGAGECVHIDKSDGVPCGSGTCSGGACKASCQGGGKADWNETQSSWYGNPGIAGTYECEATLPDGSFVDGATVQLSPNDPQKRTGTATATCSGGTWQVTGSCDGKVIDTLINAECTASTPASRQKIAGWYRADLYRCADVSGLDYWTGQYDDPSPTICTPASNYDGFGTKDACWRNSFRISANANGGTYDEAQALGHVTDTEAETMCPSGAYYPWSSLASNGMHCKYGP